MTPGDQDLLSLTVALALGAFIGLERELSDKAAGLRTNILICVGSCLFAILSRLLADAVGTDVTRIAAQIVSGIGFLGAGAIMREGEHVTGLTTAATIWTVAAIGMGVGYGFWALAAWAALLVLFIQLAFTQLDILIDTWRMRHTFRIISKLDDKSLHEIGSIFRGSHVHVLRRKLMKRSNLYYSEWYTKGGRGDHEKVLERLLESKEVLDLSY